MLEIVMCLLHAQYKENMKVIEYKKKLLYLACIIKHSKCKATHSPLICQNLWEGYYLNI